MHKYRRPKQLTASATAKLTPEEEARVTVRAEAAGLTKSEWCRQALLQALDAAPDTRLILSELAALRAVLFTLHSDALAKVESSQDRLKQLVAKAEREKFAMADKRIHAYRSQQLPQASSNDASTEF